MLHKAEQPIVDPEWRPEPQGGHTPVLVTGYGGTEGASFTETAGQDRHKHRVGLEIYTVLEGKMTIRIEDRNEVNLEAEDDIRNDNRKLITYAPLAKCSILAKVKEGEDLNRLLLLRNVKRSSPIMSHLVKEDKVNVTMAKHYPDDSKGMFMER